MASLNKATLIGNLGKDPEVRYMTNGEAVANFSIATTEKWKGQDGQVQEKTEWHNIVMFKKLAEIAEKYLKKGSQVYLEGKITTRKWQDKTTGQDRYTTEIVASEMKMLGGKSAGAATPDADGAAFDASQKQTAKPINQGINNYAKAKNGTAVPVEFNDDIPF